MGMTANKPTGLEWLALQIRAARAHRVHLTMDDLLAAIDQHSGEKLETIFDRAIDKARARQALEGTL